MATNPPKNNARKGAVRGRSQTFNPKTKRYVKRDTSTGKFIDVKSVPILDCSNFFELMEKAIFIAKYPLFEPNRFFVEKVGIRY